MSSLVNASIEFLNNSFNAIRNRFAADQFFDFGEQFNNANDLANENLAQNVETNNIDPIHTNQGQNSNYTNLNINHPDGNGQNNFDVNFDVNNVAAGYINSNNNGFNHNYGIHAHNNAISATNAINNPTGVYQNNGGVNTINNVNPCINNQSGNNQNQMANNARTVESTFNHNWNAYNNDQQVESTSFQAVKWSNTFKADFATAFEQLVRSLKYYEKLKTGFGFDQFERFREMYPTYSNTLDHAGFSYTFLGLFMHNYINKSEMHYLRDGLLNMNIKKRKNRSQWFVDLKKLEEEASNKPKATDMDVGLPYDSNIESIPRTSQMTINNSSKGNKAGYISPILDSTKREVRINSKLTQGYLCTKVHKKEPTTKQVCVIQANNPMSSSDSSTPSEEESKKPVGKSYGKYRGKMAYHHSTSPSESSSDSIASDSEEDIPTINQSVGKAIKPVSKNSSKNRTVKSEDDDFSMLRALQLTNNPPIDVLKNKKQDATEWFKHFEMIAMSVGWDSRIMGVKLPVYLKGEAFHIWNGLSKQRNDYKIIKSALIKGLVSDNVEQIALDQFTRLEQKCDESAEEFSRRLRKTAKKTNIRLSEKTLINRFLNGISDDLSIAISALSHETLAEATKTAKRVEETQNKRAEKTISSIVKSPNNVFNNDRRVKFEVNTQQAVKKVEPSSSTPTQQNKVVCFYCNIPGHYRNECEAYLKEKGRSRCNRCGKNHSGPCQKNF